MGLFSVSVFTAGGYLYYWFMPCCCCCEIFPKNSQTTALWASDWLHLCLKFSTAVVKHKILLSRGIHNWLIPSFTEKAIYAYFTFLTDQSHQKVRVGRTNRYIYLLAFTDSLIFIYKSWHVFFNISSSPREILQCDMTADLTPFVCVDHLMATCFLIMNCTLPIAGLAWQANCVSTK